MQGQTNIRIIELLRFLYMETDEDHPATVSDIAAYLKGKDIQAVRQTVYTDLKALSDAGFDIVVNKSTQNQYFMGNRIFEYPELKMLVDAIASSKVISCRKTVALIQKLCRLASTYQAEQLHGLAALDSRIKPDNEQVYYIIDSIYSALLENRQIQFQYYEYTKEKQKVLKHDGYQYLLDPYALEWKNDHYYLIGFSHKHQGVAHFRVDRIAGVKALETRFIPPEGFDAAAYTNKIIDMFATGRTVHVELLCDNDLMRVIIDQYGEDIPTRRYDKEHFVAEIEADPSGNFFGWVFQFMGKIKILSPQECVEEMRRTACVFL
ncbi:Predicted DNA-binding transcriptional regulator YafY, contains an HTH and WYL domains [Ruminococcaceae bacterium D5]|nr:Predicted DNA-binding transcriptional regulator YafY, contains an HTH and WYL domains [Ruminococcaceae bacterium D5]